MRGLLLFVLPLLALLNILLLITRFFPMLAVWMDRFHILQWLIEYTNWVHLVTGIYCYHIAWENRWHLATVPMVSPPSNGWETNTEIPYWWHITTQIWVVLLIGRAAWEIWFNQSGALPRSVQWHVISMEFLHSFLRRHSVGKPVVASPNVSCFLRLAILLIISRKN